MIPFQIHHGSGFDPSGSKTFGKAWEELLPLQGMSSHKIPTRPNCWDPIFWGGPRIVLFDSPVVGCCCFFGGKMGEYQKIYPTKRWGLSKNICKQGYIVITPSSNMYFRPFIYRGPPYNPIFSGLVNSSAYLVATGINHQTSTRRRCERFLAECQNATLVTWVPWMTWMLRVTWWVFRGFFGDWVC